MNVHEVFDLSAHGPDTFVGVGPQYWWGGLYGGQIVAQALYAAASTVNPSEIADGAPPADKHPHSLRAYFIRRGDHAEPIRYEVDRIRNGASFSTRRVVARQAIGAILNLEASFQIDEASVDLTPVTMPSDVPRPDALVVDDSPELFERADVPDEHMPDGMPGHLMRWLRCKDRLGDDRLLHQCMLAYMSDNVPAATVMRARGVTELHSGIASLDHTIWFHRHHFADQWHLYDLACQRFVGNRGLTFGHVFAADGAHVATVAQEVLVREQRER